MGADQTSLDRIRNATFPSARRGYDKREVERFLARLADWLETGAGDEERSDAVKRELERVGQRTGAILAQAEESAQQIRAEAKEEAGETIAEANAAAEQTRAEADGYAHQTRGEADAYAGKIRSAADTYGEETRGKADTDAGATRSAAESDARETTEQARAQADRIMEEGNKRRRDIEAVIADLVGRRNEILGDIDELTGKLRAAASQHRPPPGEDPFSEPESYDPLDAEAAETEVQAAEPDREPEPEEESSRVES
jgi:DivIVA domain-containing protein